MNVRTIELNFDKKETGTSITDITRQVEHSLIETQINNGMIIVFANSPCASISTMEFEPGMVSDVKQAIGKLMPNGDDNRYGRGMPNVAAHNSHSNGHATSNLNGSANGHASVGDPMQSLIGPGITLPFKDNRLMLGKWQEIVLLDFSKAKGRMKVTLQIMGEELQHFE